MAQYAGKSSIDNLNTYEPMSVTDFPVSNYVSTVRGMVSKGIEENTKLKIAGQNVAAFLYNTGMSIADSATQVAALGPYATVLMGMSAASNGARDVVARGGSNHQAFMSGLASGAAETLFEKISVGNLLKPRTISGWKVLLKETAKQAGVEASEEIATEIANIFSDAAIMGQNSNFNNAVREYKSQGMSGEGARQKAYLDLVAQVGWAGTGGALSGGLMGGAVNGINYAGNADINAAERRADGSIDRAYNAMNQYGVFSQEAGDAMRSANRANGLPLHTPVNLQGRTGENPSTAFGGPPPLSGEARGDERGQDAAARERDGQQKTASTGEPGNSGIIKFNKHEAENLTSSKGIVDGYGMTFRQFIDNVKNIGNTVRFYFGKASEAFGRKVATEVGQDVTGYNINIRSDEVAHTLEAHGNVSYEAKRGQLAVTPEVLSRLPEVFSSPDEVVLLPKKDYAGRTAFEVRKWVDGYMVAVIGIANGKHSIEVDSVRITNKKGPPTTTNVTHEAFPDLTSKTSSGQPLSFNTIISSDNSGVKSQDTHGMGSAFLSESEVDGETAGFYNGKEEADSYAGGEEGAVDSRAVYGGDVRGENPRTYAGGTGRYQAISGAAEIRARDVAEWAEGHIIKSSLSQTATHAVEQAKKYIPDIVVVENSTIKRRNPSALALTSDGVIYLSDTIPTGLEVVVPYHEIVHAVKQRESAEYRSFLDNVGGRIDFHSGTAERVLNIILQGRFEGKSLFDLNALEQDAAYDELNAVVWGFYKADPENARTQFGGIFTDYDGYIAELDAIMEDVKAAAEAERLIAEGYSENEPNHFPEPELEEGPTSEQQRIIDDEWAGGASDFGSTPVPLKKDATFRTVIPVYSSKVNESISRAGKHTVRKGSEHQGEHLVLVDTSTGEWVFEEAGGEVTVGSSRAFQDFADRHPEGRFVYVHSHPSGKGFSLNDMAEFFGTDQYESMVAAGYNGKVYAVYGKHARVSAWNEVIKPEVDNPLLRDLRQRYKNGKINEDYFKKEAERLRVQYLQLHFCSMWEAET